MLCGNSIHWSEHGGGVAIKWQVGDDDYDDAEDDAGDFVTHL